MSKDFQRVKVICRLIQVGDEIRSVAGSIDIAEISSLASKNEIATVPAETTLIRMRYRRRGATMTGQCSRMRKNSV
jgi:hypothetical protein